MQDPQTGSSAQNPTEAFLAHFSGRHIFASIPDGEHGTPFHYYNDAGESLTNLNGASLQHDNKKGRGVFFTVNELDQSLDPDHKRTEKMLVRIRAVFADDDEPRDEPRTDWPIPPNLIVNSSAGKFHYYWLIHPDEKITVDQFNSIQHSICSTFKTDKQAKDVVRVLRLPGFNHVKGEPYRVQAIELEPHPYTHASLCKHFPPVAETYDDNGKEREYKPEHYKTIDECIEAYRLGHRHGPSMSLGWLLTSDKIPFDVALGKMMELFPDVAAEHHVQSLASAMKKKGVTATASDDFESFTIPETIDAKDNGKAIDLDWPPGRMGQLAKSAYAAQFYQNKTLAIYTAFLVVAGIAARIFNISGTGLNMLITFLMDTSMGKDAADTFITDVYRLLDEEHLMNGRYESSFHGPKFFTGAKAMSHKFQQSACFVSIFGEAGFVLSSESGDTAGKRRMGMQAYTRSGEGKVLKSEGYSNPDDSIPDLHAPCMSCMYESTPGVFLDAMRKMKANETGETTRNTMIRIIGDRPPENRNVVFSIDEDVVTRLGELAAKSMETNLKENPKPKHLERNSNSYEFSDMCNSKMNQYKKEGDVFKSAVFARMSVKRMKFEALMLVLEDRDEWSEAYDYSVKMVEFEESGLSHFYKGAQGGPRDQVMGVVGHAIVQILNNERKAKNQQMPVNLRRLGLVSMSTLNQVVKSSQIVKDWGDPEERMTVKSGLKKILDFMVSDGLLVEPTGGHLEMLGHSRMKNVYGITDEFSVAYRDTLKK